MSTKIRSCIDDLDRQVISLYDKFQAGEISEETYLDLVRSLDRECSELEYDLEEE